MPLTFKISLCDILPDSLLRKSQISADEYCQCTSMLLKRVNVTKISSHEICFRKLYGKGCKINS